MLRKAKLYLSLYKGEFNSDEKRDLLFSAIKSGEKKTVEAVIKYGSGRTPSLVSEGILRCLSTGRGDMLEVITKVEDSRNSTQYYYAPTYHDYDNLLEDVKHHIHALLYDDNLESVKIITDAHTLLAPTFQEAILEQILKTPTDTSLVSLKYLSDKLITSAQDKWLEWFNMADGSPSLQNALIAMIEESDEVGDFTDIKGVDGSVFAVISAAKFDIHIAPSRGGRKQSHHI